MTKQELEKLYIETEHSIFTPLYTFDDYMIVKDEETGEIISEEYINLIIIKTANEVYEEWLYNRENPPETQPDKMEVLEKKVAELEEEKKLLQKENKLLHAQVEVLGDTADFHEELITEMAMKVYA